MPFPPVSVPLRLPARLANILPLGKTSTARRYCATGEDGSGAKDGARGIQAGWSSFSPSQIAGLKGSLFGLSAPVCCVQKSNSTPPSIERWIGSESVNAEPALTGGGGTDDLER